MSTECSYITHIGPAPIHYGSYLEEKLPFSFSSSLEATLTGFSEERSNI